jgi:F-type H+-transporting ATPase subunit gamma
MEDLIGTVKVMLDAYDEGEIDRLYLVHNEFVNTMTQQPRIHQMVPVSGEIDQELEHHWDYIYEPDAETLLNSVMTRYIEALVYQGVLENLASEHAARMIAMKSATENAGEIIKQLSMTYNRARQAQITGEIMEIIGGVEALSG